MSIAALTDPAEDLKVWSGNGKHIGIALKVKVDPLSLWRYNRDLAIFEVTILEEELVGLRHLWGVLFRLPLRVPQTGCVGRTTWEIDSNKCLVVLGMKIAWMLVDIVYGPALPQRDALGLWVGPGLSLQLWEWVEIIGRIGCR